ncbi:MAG: hypothetical protein WDA53_09350 [Bacillota bacterium]
MDPFLLSQKHRSLQRAERFLKSSEREQLRVLKEVSGTLELTKKRLERRQEWLKGLTEALSIETNNIRQLQKEVESLLGDTVSEADQARERAATEHQDLVRQLEQLETQEQLAAEQEKESGEPEIDDVKIFIPSSSRGNPATIPSSEIKVQWYHPGQQGFSL